MVVPSVIAGGGDILKYVGDAVIAIFPVTGDDPTPACGSALTAARTALATLQAAPQEIQQNISIDIALHYGDAAYGNIGSGNRLDFTAVGRDVNILGRLELLCKDVGRPLLMTDTFAVEVAEPVIEIGHFELRGFRRHQAVYALCQEGEQPCRPESSSAIQSNGFAWAKYRPSDTVVTAHGGPKCLAGNNLASDRHGTRP